jgi:TolB-like protein
VEVAATIAVLPFENPAGDPGQEYLARGFVGEVVTELSRFPTLEVIHPRTSFPLGQAACPTRCESASSSRASVRRLGEIVRVTAQLVEADAGRQVWAERFDAPAERLLEVQDEIVARVTSALAIQIDRARLRRARRTPVSSLEVYDCWPRGLDCLRRGTDDLLAADGRRVPAGPSRPRRRAGASPTPG